MRKNIKLLLFAGSYDGNPEEGTEMTSQLVSRLNKEGINVILVTYFKEQKLLLGKKGLTCVYIPKAKEKFRFNNTTRTLRELEIKYDFCAERILLGDDDYTQSVPRKRAFVDLTKYFLFWEEFLKKEKPDLIFGGDNRFGNLVPYYVSKKLNIPYEIIYFSAVVSNHFVITKNKDGRLTELEAYWKKNKNKELTKDEKEVVENYVKKCLENKSTVINTKPRINFAKVKYALERIYASLFIEKNDTPYLKPWRGIKSYFVRFVKSYWSKVYFEKPKKDEKFIYFPLHVHLETVLLISNHQFFHQERLAKLIAQNLPAGYKLYVKAHPGYIGGHELSLFRTIRKIPNARLIDPFVNSSDLIKKSSATIVIAGTAGWETLILKKPVISFGINYYNASGLTYQVKDLSEIYKVINKALKNEKLDLEVLFKYINAYVQTSYPGQISFTGLYHANASNKDLILGEDNLNKVISSLITHLKRR